jgi:hypothetical protein
MRSIEIKLKSCELVTVSFYPQCRAVAFNLFSKPNAVASFLTRSAEFWRNEAPIPPPPPHFRVEDASTSTVLPMETITETDTPTFDFTQSTVRGKLHPRTVMVPNIDEGILLLNCRFRSQGHYPVIYWSGGPQCHLYRAGRLLDTHDRNALIAYYKAMVQRCKSAHLYLVGSSMRNAKHKNILKNSSFYDAIATRDSEQLWVKISERARKPRSKIGVLLGPFSSSSLHSTPHTQHEDKHIHMWNTEIGDLLRAALDIARLMKLGTTVTLESDEKETDVRNLAALCLLT